jgi:hypothetical protein
VTASLDHSCRKNVRRGIGRMGSPIHHPKLKGNRDCLDQTHYPANGIGGLNWDKSRNFTFFARDARGIPPKVVILHNPLN